MTTEQQQGATRSPLALILIASAVANTITALCLAYVVVTIKTGGLTVRGLVSVAGTVAVEQDVFSSPLSVKIIQDARSDALRVSMLARPRMACNYPKVGESCSGAIEMTRKSNAVTIPHGSARLTTIIRGAAARRRDHANAVRRECPAPIAIRAPA